MGFIKTLNERYGITHRLKELFRFSVSGFSCFGIDIGVMALLNRVFGVHYLLSAAVSFSVALVINYFINITWVFRAARGRRGRFVLYVLISLLELGLNQLFLWLAVSRLGLDSLLAKTVISLPVSGVIYLLKRWTILKTHAPHEPKKPAA